MANWRRPSHSCRSRSARKALRLLIRYDVEFVRRHGLFKAFATLARRRSSGNALQLNDFCTFTHFFRDVIAITSRKKWVKVQKSLSCRALPELLRRASVAKALNRPWRRTNSTSYLISSLNAFRADLLRQLCDGRRQFATVYCFFAIRSAVKSNHHHIGLACGLQTWWCWIPRTTRRKSWRTSRI